MSGRKPERRGGSDVLRFLDNHLLDHTPENYAFAFRVLNDGDPSLKREVARLTDGNVRITRDEVARLMPADIAGEAAPKLDRLTLRVLDIIGEAAMTTGVLNRELVGTATSLIDLSGDIGTILAAMIDRTAQAEASFADATRQAQSLREELNTLRNDANRDRLTGLLNRQGVDARIAEAVTAAKGCAIALIDVDRFKAINGAHGHAIGDRVLQAIATELGETCHPHTIARLGDDRFVVLMLDLSAGDAGAIVERARASIARRQLKVRESGAPIGTVTFSAGVSSSRGRSGEDMVASAVALLGQAKQSGRNRVQVEPRVVDVTPPSG